MTSIHDVLAQREATVEVWVVVEAFSEVRGANDPEDGVCD